MLVDGLQHMNLKEKLKTILATPAIPGCHQKKSLGLHHQAAQLGGSFHGLSPLGSTTAAAAGAALGGRGAPRASLEGWAGGGSP